jgi:hypothetical protein
VSQPDGGRWRVSRVLGEIALIFIGITSALWFEDLNEARHRRQLETLILHEMSAALTRDTVDLHINLDVGESVLASIDTVLAQFRNSAAYREGLAMHFARSSRFVRFFHSPAAYEHLRSAGFDVIANDTLRQSIISYYGGLVPVLTWVDEVIVINNWESVLRPQIMAKFRYESYLVPAVPRSYASLRDDGEYQNALRMTANGLGGQLDVTRRTLAAADALLAGIERELRGR